MRRYDPAPFLRSSIGFDRFDQLLDAASRIDGAANPYPPYNIEKFGDTYRISLAVVGFSDDNVDVTVKENVLVEFSQDCLFSVEYESPPSLVTPSFP